MPGDDDLWGCAARRAAVAAQRDANDRSRGCCHVWSLLDLRGGCEMALSPRKRFEILKRDNYTCRYCGRRQVRHLSEVECRQAMMAVPQMDTRQEMTLRQIGLVPDIVLEIDHVVPRSKGGTDDPSNLVTACLDCNRGKAGVPLDSN